MSDKEPGSKGGAKKPQDGKASTRKSAAIGKDAVTDKSGTIATKSGASGKK